MTTDPKAAAIIDELLVIFNQGARIDDRTKERALRYLAETRLEHPDHPITLSLVKQMQKRGLYPSWPVAL